MPSAAPKPCRHPGCGVLVRDGTSRCALHVKVYAQASDAQRGSANDRGYSYAWQKARAGYLKSHPLCVRHEKRSEVVAATVVDHIVPHRGDKALFWDYDNWQALCKTCHDIKTAMEDGAFGRPLAQGGGPEIFGTPST